MPNRARFKVERRVYIRPSFPDGRQFPYGKPYVEGSVSSNVNAPTGVIAMTAATDTDLPVGSADIGASNTEE